MRTIQSLIILVAISLVASPVIADSTGTKVVVEVTLGKIVAVLGDSIPGAGNKIPDKVKAQNYVANLRQLLSKAGHAEMIVRRPMEDPLVQAFLKGKKVQWELIFAYFQAVMEATWPTLSKVNWVASIVSRVVTPTDANVGAAFEFCDPRGMKRDVGHRYVRNMLETWKPEEFARVLQRKGCASAMLGYFVAAE